jgi:hypothetical protein
VKEKRSNTTRRNQQTTNNKKHYNSNYERTIQLLIFIALSSILNYFSSLRTK